MAGAKIDCYLDCVSPYSYFAFLHLRRNRPLLLSHSVTVEFHPIFLGGIMGGSGNKPPWTNPVKQRYGTYDFRRSARYFGVPNIKAPPFFPIVSLYPQRCMAYIKDNYPQEVYEKCFEQLWLYTWEKNVDVTIEENLAAAFGEVLKSEEEVKKVLEMGKSQEVKDKLTENTKKALDQGAYGAPWMWVSNGRGGEQPFFGSDRFHYMWEFLGLPWEDFKILEKKGEEKANL